MPNIIIFGFVTREEVNDNASVHAARIVRVSQDEMAGPPRTSNKSPCDLFDDTISLWGHMPRKFTETMCSFW